jgi:hypothetical protein
VRENDIKSRRDGRTIRRNFPAAPLGLEIVFFDGDPAVKTAGYFRLRLRRGGCGSTRRVRRIIIPGCENWFAGRWPMPRLWPAGRFEWPEREPSRFAAVDCGGALKIRQSLSSLNALRTETVRAPAKLTHDQNLPRE